jgi:outer membrane protein OmpA-like peptidoglycan-associated protein
MASSTALRMMLGASLGLGAFDLLLIDVALAPEVVADSVVSPRFTPQDPLLAVVATGTAAPLAPAPEPVAVVAASPVVKSHVYFKTMSATLDGTARVALDALAVTGATIVLEGHADERGDDGYNTKLSRKRALAVQRYLVERGAERERIKVRFAGEDGADDPDLWRDRRVDIQITGGPR